MRILQESFLAQFFIKVPHQVHPLLAAHLGWLVDRAGLVTALDFERVLAKRADTYQIRRK